MINKPIIYFNSLDSLSGNGLNAGTDGHIPAYNGNKDIIAMINNDAYFYNNSVSLWEKINEDYVAGDHINISQNKIIEVSGWENKLDTSAYKETSANIINIIENKVDISAFVSATSSINETIENKISLTEEINLVIDTVTANSANWNNDLDTLYSSGPNIDITNNTISSKDWTPELNTKLDSTDFSNVSGTFVQTLPTSANWDNTYDTVTNNSANWDKVNEYSAGSNVDITNHIISSKDWTPELSAKLDTSAFSNVSGKDWTTELNTKLNSSAFSDVSGTFVQTLSESANWTNAYDTVTANSANWNNDLDALYLAGPNIDITDNTISSKDWTPELNAKLDSSAFTLSTSADWTKAYETVTVNSATWNEVNEYLAGPNIDITDNTISSKDWTPELNAKLDSTAFTLSTSSNWTKAYETVTANSANWDEGATYLAGSNIEITNNTISSRDWTPELSAKLDTSAFSNVSGKFVQTLEASANWDNTYSAVNSESANWNNTYDTVTANSASWNNDLDTLYSAGSNISITNNTISSKDWTPELNAKLNSTAFTLPSSSNWTKAYDTVTANSASWDEVIQYSAGSNINITNNTISSKDWTPELNAKLNSSAFTLPTSSDWTKAYETVTANSASWDDVNEYSAGSNINITNNTISSKDWTPELNAKLNSSAFSNVSGKFVQTLEASANWNNVYNTVTTNSANWENEIDVSNFVTSSTDLSGSYILSSNGSTTLWSQLDENYDLSGFNGIIISANSANKTIDVGYNGGGPTSEVFYKLSAGQNIGIQSANDGTNDYLIISANANSNVSLPESANWNNTYSSVTNNSANWNSVSSVTSNIMNLSAGQNIGIQSATIGDTHYLVISANAITEIDLPESANWNNTYSTVNSESANWNNTYSTVNSESASWNSVSSVTGNIMNLSAGSNIGIQSATIEGKDYLVISANAITEIDLPTSANWTKAYDTVTANSANWNSDLNTLYSAGSNINITNNTISSKDWTPELNTKLNSSAFTLPTSSDWTKAYETVTANSASWDDVSAKLNTTAFSSVSGNFLTAIPDEYSTKDYVQSSVSSKLDTTAFSTVSGSFLTAHQTLEGYATTGDVESAVSSKLDTTVFSTVSGSFLTAHQDLSDYATTVELADKLDTTAFSDVSGSFLTAHQDISNLMPKSESANFYPMTGNPSSFLTAHQDLSNYATTASVTAKLDTTAFDLPNSANWDNTYNAVDSSSANWDNTYDTVTANSANWNSDLDTLYSAGSNINITNNTISSKDWTPELNAKLNSTAFSLPTSSNWTKAYDTVTANSASWENEIDVSNFVTSSTDLSGSYILSSNGSTTTWHELEEEYELSGLNGVFISANSANKSIDISLTECYDISGFNGILVSANSANKTIDITYSGNLDDLTNNTFILQAGQNVVLTSGENGDNKYLTISAAGIESIGTPYELSGGENINITSASIGTNNYLVISAKGGDSLGTPYNLSAGQNIGIQSATDGINDYLVISANAITEIDLPQSANWNNTYSTVNSESANWNSVSSVTGNILNLSAGQNIGIQSATDGINDYLVISANAITEIDLPQSANWNNTYSTVTNNSANWNSISSVTSNILNLSAGQNIGIQSATIEDTNYLVISANAITEIDLPQSANWNNTYSTVTNNSANWNNTYSTVNSESANWNSVSSVTGNILNLSAGQNIGIQSANDGTSDYLIISANSNSNVSLPESANWTKAYDMVTANSANWDEVIQYSAGSNINITNNTISSKDWTPELNTKLNSTAFTLQSSANWNNTYNTVNSESANWNSISSVTSNIMNLSAGQNIGIHSATIGDTNYLVISAIGGGEGATYVAGSNISITNNTISSRDWTPELNTKLNSTAFSLPSSSNWTKAYDTVTANSANWNNDLDTLYSAGTNINITNNTISSKDWTPELNTKLNSSAFSNVSGKFVQTLASSANWNNTYSTVMANSANWNSVSSVTSNIMNLSAGQNIGIQSATDGINDYLVISAIGGGEGATYVAGSNISITNNTISSKDWTPELNAKLNSTAFSNVSGKFVQTLASSANWTKAYDTVTANSANWNNDLDTLYSAGSNINITNNTISSKDWTPELNTKLNSTAFKLPSSANWNNTYSTVTNNSANWNNIYSTVIANSSIWDDVTEYSAGSNINITNNTISSKDWTPELNTKLNSTAFKLPSSANWNNTYNTVTNNSADWSGMYSLVAGNSGYWGQGEGTVFELYSSNGTIGISSTTATGNKIIYDISLEGTTTSRNYFINRQEQTDAAEYLPNTNITLPDLGNGWQIVNGEANYGDIKYTSLSAYSMNGSAYIIPEEVKLASVDIRLDVIIPSGGLSANYQKVEIVIFDDIKNEYIGKYEKWIDISYDRTEQLNFSEIITEPSSVKLYFRSEFACQTYCRTFSLVDLTYKMLLINNNVTGGSVSLPTSANWNNTYSTVANNSANWNSVSSLSAKSDSILCQNISYTTTGSNINVTIPNNTYATVSGLNVTGTINVIIPATNVTNGSELNSCAGRLMFSTNKPSTLNFVDSSITSKLPVIGQLPTTYSGTNYQFTCVAGVVACQEIKTIT